jgi:acyl-CoA thioesterase
MLLYGQPLVWLPGFAVAVFSTVRGQLVASVAQEGLTRVQGRWK